jgi:hypothetical protein
LYSIEGNYNGKKQTALRLGGSGVLLGKVIRQLEVEPDCGLEDRKQSAVNSIEVTPRALT